MTEHSLKNRLKQKVKENIVFKKIRNFLINAYDKVLSLRKNSPIFRMLYCPIGLVYHKKSVNLSVRDFCKANGIGINTESEPHERLVYTPPIVSINGKEKGEEILFSTPDIFSCVLDNVVVTGGCVYIIKDKYCLNEQFSLPQRGSLDFVNDSLCLKYDDKESVVEINIFSKNIEEGINLFGDGSANYYHWLFNVCGNMAYINKHPELSKIPLLVDEATYERKSFIEVLKYIDCYDHPIYVLNRNKTYKVKKLYYFSPCYWGGVYPKDNPNNRNTVVPHMGYARNEEVVELFRKIIDKVRKPGKRDERIFIIRGSRKRLVNEEEAFKIASEFGFKRFIPEEHTLAEQISAFNAADYVIADYGAGCTNIVWGKNGQAFIVLTPSNRIDYTFSSLARASGVDYTAFLAGKYDGNLNHTMDLDMFKKYLEMHFGKMQEAILNEQ